MRKIAAAVLAIPVLVGIYLPVVLRRQVAARLGLVIGVGGLLGVGALGILPRGTTALPASAPAPVEATRFGPAVIGEQKLNGAVLVKFSSPMDASSVEAALSVEPAAEIALTWLDQGRGMLVAPRDSWTPGTYYTVTIGTAARDTSGHPLADPLRTAFYTRPATTSRIEATEMVGKRVGVETAFAVAFDRPVGAAAARAAFRIEPAVEGELFADDVDEETTTTRQLTFVPDEQLGASTRYVVTLAPLVDAEGAPVVVPAALTVQTADAPSVVRFRPRNGTEDVGRDVALSVRFTRAMDRRTTEAAFSAVAKGKAITGRTTWVEGDTVLVLEPADLLPYGTEITLTVAAGARSADGIDIAKTRVSTFTTVAKPKPAAPKPAPKPKPKPAPKPSGGTGAGSSSWYAAEKYLLRLINCTRGGGWVESNGSCSSPGGSGIPALALDPGISTKVSRPYAKLLVDRGLCTHFADGNPGDRLRRAGYTSYHWAENLSCAYNSNLDRAAINLVRFFQSEKYWSPQGGHWVNMMNREYDRAGVGLWVAGGRMHYVIDFYHP